MAALQLTGPTTSILCYKLLWICYYYARCSGIGLIGIRQCEKADKKTKAHLQEAVNIQTCINRQIPRKIKPSLLAHSSKTRLWLHALICLSLCLTFTYLVTTISMTQDYIFSFLIYAQFASIVICAIVMAIVGFYRSERVVLALNALFRLIVDVNELHCAYGLFQWTHVVFVALKILTFLYEIGLSLQGVFMSESIKQIILLILQSILLIEIWFNIHAATLLYMSLDAIYGVLNHYMKHVFIPRVRLVQTFGQLAIVTHVDRLTLDMARYLDLFKSVHRVGTELHILWQVPLASTLVYAYCAMISVLYYIIWQYYEADELHVRFIPFLSKLVADILLLSLAAHRAIKSSQLIRCIGLENVVLVEDDKWHRQMDQSLYHFELYGFKLRLLGLYDISNGTTVAFIGGILTSICIFVTFFMETYKSMHIKA